MIHFLTTHGTVLVRGEGEAISHAPLRELSEPSRLVGLDIPIGALRQDFREFLQRDAKPPIAFETDWSGAGRVHVDVERNLVHLERGGQFLSAGGEGGGTAWIDGTPDEWERLLPLSDDDLARIVQFFSGAWIIRSRRIAVRGWDVALTPGFRLRFGPIEIPLAFNLPFDGRTWPFRTTVLLEGWRIEEICLYRPLVYYSASNSPAVQAQLVQSIQSLLEFGKYDGEVHVLTNLSHDELCRRIEHFPRDRLSVQALEPTDFVGYVAAKYAILEHEPAWRYQPVVYLDSDIVINASLREMLVEIATSEHIAAPIERVGPMRNWPSVGASLVQRDGHDPRFADGFNAGTIGIPNLAAHAQTLRLIRQIIANILKTDGRGVLQWVDQEVANYVSFRVGCVDTYLISRYVRYAGAEAAGAPGLLNGMVHFWNTGPLDRAAVMGRYVEALRAHARSGHHLA